MTDSPSSPLSRALTLDAVLSQASDKTFARGKAYFLDGLVSRLDLSGQTNDVVRATVHGTHRYTVELGADTDGSLRYDCTCPVGDDGTFCKHAVAVALSWLENTGEEVFRADDETGSSSASGRPRKKRKTHAEQVEAFVATLDEPALRTWLLDAAQRDAVLRDKLLFAAHASRADDLASLKTAVRQATRVPHAARMYDDGAARQYAERLLSLADMLRERLDGPLAAQVAELVELAIANAEARIEQIDDSDGDVIFALETLASLHGDACVRTRADGVALAERLFQIQIENPWGALACALACALPKYREALGEKGLQQYRERVERAWAELPALKPDATGRGSRGWLQPPDPRRNALERAMKSLADLDGDVNQLIQIEAQDLSSTQRFLLVAQLCVRHHRHDEALAWAQRGLQAFKKEPDPALLDFCIQAHLRRSEHAEANALAWERFMLRPMSRSMPSLLAVARAGRERDAVHERALAHFRAWIAREEKAKGARSTVPRTELVKALLAAKNASEAWAVFTGGEVSPEVWHSLADARGHTHPHEAIALYHRLLPQTVQVQPPGSARYDEAFAIVQAIGELRERAGERDQFAAELAEIRQRWKAKRNFMARLAVLG